MGDGIKGCIKVKIWYIYYFPYIFIYGHFITEGSQTDQTWFFTRGCTLSGPNNFVIHADTELLAACSTSFPGIEMKLTDTLVPSSLSGLS